MGCIIRAAGPFNRAHAETMIRPSDIPGTVIDLANARVLDPYGLVVVACAAMAAVEAGAGPLTFIPPRLSNTSNYLSRMNLPAFLAEYCRLDSRLPARRSGQVDPTCLCEIRRFTPDDDRQELADLLAARLHGVAAGDVIIVLLASLWELIDNTLFHAHTSGSVVAAQVYDRHSDRARVDLAIGDVGIGIRASLQNSPTRYDAPDDSPAIELALRENVSATGDPARGVGLTAVWRDIRVLRGTTLVRSGTAACVIHPKAPPSHSRGRGSIPGTVVALSIPCHQRQTPAPRV